MWAAPIGAFGAIAFTVGKFGAGSLLSLGKLLISFYVTCLIFIVAVLWPIAHFTGVSLFRFIRYIQRRAVDRDRDDLVGNRAAAHDRKARSGWLR
jgi:Na+/H+-dicarboxylate symporter